LSSSSNPFTDTLDGITYTVTVTSSTGAFSYTSNDPNDPSGTGSALSTGPVAVGKEGLTIDMGVSGLVVNNQYVIQVGTQSASALSLNTGVSGAAVTTVSGNTPPVLVGNGTTVTGGGASSTLYGSGVKFVSAATGTGMGTYDITPGVSFTSDSNAFAATYSAGVQYTIASGP
ncbi:MAG: hypothetical protein ACYCO3_14565, partial [Mycobacteriales bacterium]